MSNKKEQEYTSKPGFKKDEKSDSLRRKHTQPEIPTQHPASQNSPYYQKLKERYGNKKRHTEYRHEDHERRKNHRHDTKKEDRRSIEIEKFQSFSLDLKRSTEKENKKREKERSKNTDTYQKTDKKSEKERSKNTDAYQRKERQKMDKKYEKERSENKDTDQKKTDKKYEKERSENKDTDQKKTEKKCEKERSENKDTDQKKEQKKTDKKCEKERSENRDTDLKKERQKMNKKCEKERFENKDTDQKKERQKTDDLGTRSVKKRLSSEESGKESARKKQAVKDKNVRVPEMEHIDKAKEIQGVSKSVSPEKKKSSCGEKETKAAVVEMMKYGEERRKHKKRDKRGVDGEYKGDEKKRKKKKEQNEGDGEASGNMIQGKPVEKEEAKKTAKEDKKKENPNVTGKEKVHIPWLNGCRSVEEFRCLNRIEEGAFGVVYRGEDKRTNTIVALKRIKLEKEREGFPITSIREINTLLKLRHPNVITLREIVVGSDMDKIFLVMDYIEHDLKSLMRLMKKKNSSFTTGEVKCLMEQLLSAIQFLHDNWILHRDLKTSNLLLSHSGILKVGDFGLAREYGSPLNVYTPLVVTLWYRAPELLLGSETYSTPVDMWSIGCIFAELLTMKPLFPSESEVTQINLLYKVLGTPNDITLPGFSDLPAVKRIRFPTYPGGQLRQMFSPSILSGLGFDLLSSFLTYDPRKRIKACNAKEHEYFDETPRAISPSMFPTWPAKSESENSVSRPKAPVSKSSMNLIKAGRFFMPGEGK